MQEDNWDDIDNIQRQTPRLQHRKPKERIPQSVKVVITEIDDYIKGGNFLTEKKFRRMVEENSRLEKANHTKASLDAMALWKSLCVPIPR